MRRLSSVSQLAVQPRGGDGMVLAADGVAHDHDPQIVGRDAGQAQSDEFCDGVVFAISGAMGEGHERRTPDVDFALLGQIAHRADRQIDRAVDLAEAGAALAGSARHRRWREIAGRPAIRSVRGRRRTAPVAPIHRRDGAARPAIFPAARLSTVLRRKDRTARRIAGSFRLIPCEIQRTGPKVYRRSEPDNAARKYSGTQSARVIESPHLTPHVRASARLRCQLVTGSFRRR